MDGESRNLQNDFFNEARKSRSTVTVFLSNGKKLTGRSVMVTLPGGPLAIAWREADDHILMTGPFALDYEGRLDPALLAPEAVS